MQTKRAFENSKEFDLTMRFSYHDKQWTQLYKKYINERQKFHVRQTFISLDNIKNVKVHNSLTLRNKLSTVKIT